MFSLNQPTHRRRFLGTLAAGAAATIGLTRFMKAAPAALLTPEITPYSPGISDEFDAWLAKIKGTYRQVFDAPDANNGFPLAWSRVFLMTNEQLGAKPDDVTAVLVLRHDAIPLAMQHDLWPKYKFGEVFKVTDNATKAPAVRNPFYQPKEGELPLPGMAIEDLQKSGVLMGVCDMALTFYSMHVGKDMGKDPAEVKKDWVAGILPGIQIVPSGVLAINRAQKAGCTYCYAG
ncbi:MAG: hypothetical protein HY033_04310 [Ignavibacteriae bacterium]|nr:hypothetical protein [Ignavibacteria bacterium]MBI3364111.1 hypothetical protein [Ignavibacteriota bacterium]